MRDSKYTLRKRKRAENTLNSGFTATGTAGAENNKNKVTVFASSSKFHNPADIFSKAMSEALEKGRHTSEVRHIDPASRPPEKISDIELRRIRVINGIKRNPLAKQESFLNSLLHRKAPLTEAQLTHAEKSLAYFRYKLTEMNLKGQEKKKKNGL